MGQNIELPDTEKSNIASKSTRDEIFISHRSINAPVADMIKDFLVGTGITNDKIFCSSLPGNDVNELISVEVKERLKKSAVIILLLSKDYYESAYCLNEAGIAWYLTDVKIIPVGLPEINPNNMMGFVNSEYKLRRLDNDDDISYLHDEAQERTKSTFVRHGVVNQESKKLKERYSQYIANRQVDLKEAEEAPKQTATVTIEKDEGLLLVYAAYTEGRIFVINSISNSGPIISAGRFKFNRTDTQRESARWKAAVQKLEQYGFVEDSGYKEEVFSVTDSGFKAADQVKAEWDIDTDKDPGEYLD